MPRPRPTPTPVPSRRDLRLAVLALGVVFGDIGTSPLYAIRECFSGVAGLPPTPENVLGVLSLVFWALLGIVGIKYLVFMLRADNRGEGGVLALTVLAASDPGRPPPRRRRLLALGLFGAALLYGDAVLTPAISVLSATEGLAVVRPGLEPLVVPLSAAILLALFSVQSRGTGGVGSAFAPVMGLWFLVLGLLGARQVASQPLVLAALAPWHGLELLVSHGLAGWMVLGAVFLAVTGAEALYADMGHFGRRPIRLAWGGLVFPALVVNYFGQGALLLAHPEQAGHPFFGLAPAGLRPALLALATAATVIASQAVISGSFSLTRQAVQLGYLPRMRIVHTSAEEIGQIYVPLVNLLLGGSSIALVLFFRSSGRLAAAYGMAVVSTMLISTVLLRAVARGRWRWGWAASGALAAIFLAVDTSFLSANLGKLAHGAWLPLALGLAVQTVMTTWRRGRELLARMTFEQSPRSREFVPVLLRRPPHRVEGDAVFLSGSAAHVPTAFLHNLKHNRVAHRRIAFVHVRTEDLPRVPREEKVEVAPLGGGFYAVLARYGFMESPNVAHVLALAGERGLAIDPEQASYFVGRQRIVPARRPALGRWRTALFRLLSRNALDATAFYAVPPDRVMEVGAQVRL